MASFRAGDPLSSIAAAANMSSYGMLRLLCSRVADQAEEQRSRGYPGSMLCNGSCPLAGARAL